MAYRTEPDSEPLADSEVPGPLSCVAAELEWQPERTAFPLAVTVCAATEPLRTICRGELTAAILLATAPPRLRLLVVRLG